MPAPILLEHGFFAWQVGRSFAAQAPSGPTTLVLTEARLLGRAARPAGGLALELRGAPFALLFRGAPPLLPQGLYLLQPEGVGEPLEIFLVPVAGSRGALFYEAVFS